MNKGTKIQLTGIIIALFAATACENRTLSLDDFCDDFAARPPIKVKFLWEENAVPPEYMTVFWYDGTGKTTIDDYESRKTTLERGLPAARYMPFCIDLYSFDNGTMGFRGSAARETFEAYNLPGSASWYLDAKNQIPKLRQDEALVGEANPYILYLDADDARETDTRYRNDGDTLTVEFVPINPLHEFTFLIHGVQGMQYAGTGSASRRGIISGLSASYFPADRALAKEPSSLIFSRIETHINGQKYSWSTEQKQCFSLFDPDWADANKGWTGDWITGKFSSFGPVDLDNGLFRLILGFLNKGGTLYWGAWGYAAPGSRDDDIRRQLRGAWGDSGQKDVQIAWREQNGGFDIILAGDGGLVIPDAGDSGGSSGGFVVDSDDWGEEIVVK
jgi:hypothetical protein